MNSVAAKPRNNAANCQQNRPAYADWQLLMKGLALGCSDPILAVRVRAAVALNAFCESVTASMASPSPLTSPGADLLHIATELTGDCEKLRASGVQSVGEIVRWYGTQMSDEDAVDTADKVVMCLRDGGSSKVQWAACTAAGYVLQAGQQRLLLRQQQQPLLAFQKLVCALLDLTERSENMKTRSMAVTALRGVTSPSGYQGMYEVAVDHMCRLLFSGGEAFHGSEQP